MRHHTRFGAIILMAAVTTGAQALENGPVIKSRVVGEKMRAVELACKSNLENYCKSHGGGIPVNTAFKITAREPQYDILCLATCRKNDE